MLKHWPKLLTEVVKNWLDEALSHFNRIWIYFDQKASPDDLLSLLQNLIIL